MTHIHLNGSDHAVLLIHGLSGNPLEMQYLARLLQATRFSVHVPHRRVSRWYRRYVAERNT